MTTTMDSQQQQKGRRKAVAFLLLATGAGVAPFLLSSLGFSPRGALGLVTGPESMRSMMDTRPNSPSAHYYDYPHPVLGSSLALPYGNLTCPLEINFGGHHIGVLSDPARARLSYEHSLQSGAAEVVLDAVRGGAFDGRRIVLVGDSLMRYQFVSMGCLAASASSALASDGRGPPEAVTLHAPERAFSRGRMRLPGGGEIFFHPFAGALNEYNGWRGKQESEAPPEAQSWLAACRAEEPFLLEGIPDLGPRRAGWPAAPLAPLDMLAALKRDHTTPVEEYGETVTMTSSDVVFVNAAHHAGSEVGNHENIDALLRCMSNKRRAGRAHPDWPSIQYVYSSLYHPILKDGAGVDASCGQGGVLNPDLDFRGKDRVYWSRLVEHAAEYGESGMDMVGKDLAYEERGDLKVGLWTELSRKGKPLVDCIHWIFPGVPDVWVAEMVKRMHATMPGADKRMGVAASLSV